MTEERRQELKQLLEAATTKENLKIEYEHARGMIYEYELPLPVEEYRTYLQDRWAYYSAEPLGFSQDVRAHIVNRVIKSKLHDFIQKELAASIEGNNVRFISYAIEGNRADGFYLMHIRGNGRMLDEYIDHLLKITIVCGAAAAVSVFERFNCTEGVQGHFQSVVSLEGIRLESEIPVFPAVRLVTLPDSASGPIPASLLRHTPGFLFFLAKESEHSARGKTLLIMDRPLFSICHKRSQDMFDEESPIDDLPFQFNLEGEKFTNSEAVKSFEKFFCQALSLACNSAVQSSGSGWLFPEEKFFHPCEGGVSLGRSRGQFGDATFGKPTKVGETEIDEAKCLYRKLINLSSSDREKLQIPFDRWLRSKTPRNPIDKIIDLGIAFEALYLSNIKEPAELSFRLRLHAAWHRGENEKDRKRLMKKLKEIYEWRSAVVHNGKLPKKRKGKNNTRPHTTDEVDEFIKSTQDLCCKSIKKIITDGQFPDWDSLILSGKLKQASS